jgi:hypothetical protein
MDRLHAIAKPTPPDFASAIPDVPSEAQVYRISVSWKVSADGCEDRWHFIFAGPRWPVGIEFIGMSPACGPAVIQALNLAYYCGTLRGTREEALRKRGGKNGAV